MSTSISSQYGGRYRITARPRLVYGISDISYSSKVQYAWLKENFSTMDLFSTDVEEESFSLPIYGYKLTLDQDTGSITRPSPEQIRDVKKLYDILMHHYRENRYQPKMGYMNAVTVDNDLDDYAEYIPTPLPVQPGASENHANAGNEDPTNVNPITGGRRTKTKKHKKHGKSKSYKKAYYK
jgi:hypothetical protein